MPPGGVIGISVLGFNKAKANVARVTDLIVPHTAGAGSRSCPDGLGIGVPVTPPRGIGVRGF